MVCVNANQSKEGADAFTDESYHNERRGPVVGVELVVGIGGVAGSRVEMHGGRGVDAVDSRGGAAAVDFRRVSRFEGRALGSGDAQRPARRFAETSASARTAVGRGLAVEVAAPVGPSRAGGGHRLASDPVSWRAAEVRERAVPFGSQVGDD